MASLDRNLRKDLEKTVKQARRVAEAGARKAVGQLGVGDAEAPKHLTTAEQRALRNRLRAHGRQLGDLRDPRTGSQATARLVQECAYENWHRMLFARFLAENDLLIEPNSGVAITLDEVQELARDKATDWLELASRYAERMLPQIFRKGDSALEIPLPPETRSEMEDLLKGLPRDVFEADDSLGWVYQFWQAERKDEVNKSEKKIGADELPAVTQLFTEDYMVLFLLHNTLGAWWAGRVLAANPSLAASAADENALRAACKIGDVEWTYLRFVRDKGEDGTEGTWRPAAGVFEGWPKAAKEITVLDPCMGSGHFLVFALPILVAFRMAEEGLSQEAAVDAALRDNLFGLEIDPRCTQIAAFNLAFAGWRKVGYRALPQLNLACSGLAIGVTKAEWLKLAEKAVTAADPAAKRDLLGVETNLLTVGLEERVKNGLEALYDLFVKAPWLGSLVDPRGASADIFHEDFETLEPLLAPILAASDSDDTREMAVAAQGMVKAAELLNDNFTLVVTNVPYLGRGKQHETIQIYCEIKYPNSKADLSTCFVERCAALCADHGSAAVVTPQNWLFLGSYSKLRIQILRTQTLNIVSDLGPAAFNEMNWWAARTAFLVVSVAKPCDDDVYLAVNADTGRDFTSKLKVLSSGSTLQLRQSDQLVTPDSRISVFTTKNSRLLAEHAYSHKGLTTNDDPQFVRKYWELEQIRDGWQFHLSTIEETCPYGGMEHVIFFERGDGRLRALNARQDRDRRRDLQGANAWGKTGIAVTLMRKLRCSIYTGTTFDTNVAVIVPHKEEDFPAIWCFCTSPDFDESVRRIDQKVNVTNATLVKVPFDLDSWTRIAAAKYPEGLPSPSSEDPTQWLFDGKSTRSNTSLLVAVARLLGYHWPQCDELEEHRSRDGIICLTALKGEPAAEQRLNEILAAAFGANWSAAKLSGLLAGVGYAGKSLDDWLRDGFFEQHCELFHQRPFIWHIWDGRRDGFHALINYHHLAAPHGEARRTLEKLIYSYLGDWIDRQRADEKAGVEGADARLAHSGHLRGELIKILEGEPPYDMFVRWKPLHEQPIGWDPDINDGVRLNIRPFMTARPLNARGANACILRATPKIKWDKDRGKDPTRDKQDFPWFWGVNPEDAKETPAGTRDYAGGPKFIGNRWNDIHYTRSFKQAARDRAAAGGKR